MDANFMKQFAKAQIGFPNIQYSDSPDYVTPTLTSSTDSFKTETTEGTLGNTTKNSSVSTTSVRGTTSNSNTMETTEKIGQRDTTTNNNQLSLDGQTIIYGGFAVIISFIIMIGFFVIFYNKKFQNLHTEIRTLTKSEVNEFFEGEKNNAPAQDENETKELVQYMPFVRDFEITRDQLTIAQDKIIGSGQFGRVMHGLWRSIDGKEVTPVAVKTVKVDVEVKHFKAMLIEAKVMAYLGRHPNIVKLLGTYTANIKNREIFLALELCPLGDLHKFLRKNEPTYQNLFATKIKPTQESVTAETNIDIDDYSALNQISTLNLITWAQDISSGMMYLTEKNVIHGDLAARNVLLTKNRIANISDFGLSRQLLNYADYQKKSEGPLPWRWMAVESLNDMKFSVASDVWSFGVTLWEIFSMSKVPYPGWKWNNAFVDSLMSGERLLKPKYANQMIYELMKDCWKIEPSERPTFEKISSTLNFIHGFVSKAQMCKKEANDKTLKQNESSSQTLKLLSMEIGI